MLTNHLRDSEKDGLVNGVVYKEIPPNVESSFSDYGKTLELVLRQS